MKSNQLIKYFLLVLLLSLLGMPNVWAQEEPEELRPVLPPSPTAAALGKYGDYKVNGSSGVPGISVPLLEVKGTSMSVPISLSYHGSGNKVADYASWVGLGWSLNAGGVVTRSIYGESDNSVTGLHALYDQGFDPVGFDPDTDPDDYVFFEAVADNGWSADPDRYSFNVMGLSGQFYVDHLNEIHLFSDQDLEIEIVAGTGFIDKFIIKDGRGTVYEFGAKEETTNSNSTNCSDIESTDTFYSSWYLTKITKGPDEFLFTYSDETIIYGLTDSYNQSVRSTNFNDCETGTVTCISYNYLEIDKKKLLSISGPFGTANFTSNKARVDMPSSTALEHITYLDTQVDFQTTFRGTESAVNQPHLFLNAVLYKAGAQSVKKYLFNYNDVDLPKRDSHSVDHYGYYNGKNNNVSMPAYSPYFDDLEAADRSVDPQYASAGILEEIIYPTGGKTAFHWEVNNFTYTDPDDVSHRQYESKPLADTDVPNGQTYSVAFSINDDQIIGINHAVGGTANGLDQEGNPIITEYGDIDITIEEAGTGNTVFTWNVTGTSSLETSSELASGSYIFKVENTGIPLNTFSARINYYNVDLASINNPITEYVGGHRIQQIVSYDIDGEVLNTKTYQYGSRSGGSRIQDSDYYGDSHNYVIGGQSSANTPLVIGECLRVTRSSSSRRGIIPTTYEEITEYYGTELDNIGYIKTIYRDDPDSGGGALFAPNHDRSWIRNLVKEVQTYDADDIIKSKQVNNYELIERDTYAGLKVGYYRDHPDDNAFPPVQDILQTATYELKSEWAKLNTTVSTGYYYDAGVTQENQTTITYGYATNGDPYLTPFKTTTEKSNGETVTNEVLYPKNFGTAHLVAIRDDYFLQPIEQVTYLDNDRVIAGQVFEYNDNGTLKKQWRLDSQQPLDKSTFLFSNGFADSQVAGAYNLQTHYGSEEATLTYDDYRVTEVKDRSGVDKCYLWGYNNTYPVAEITNMDLTTLLTLITQADINSIKSETNNATLKTELASVRAVLPTTSLMSTYLYKVGYGVEEMLDPNEIETTFTYDDYGRLLEIRVDGELVSTYEYQYGLETE